MGDKGFRDLIRDVPPLLYCAECEKNLLNPKVSSLGKAVLEEWGAIGMEGAIMITNPLSTVKDIVFNDSEQLEENYEKGVARIRDSNVHIDLDEERFYCPTCAARMDG